MAVYWRDIPGWEGYYQASTDGRIRSVNRVIEVDGKKRNWKGRILTLFPDKDGYLRVKLCRNGKYPTHKVHRLVASTFLLSEPNEKQVNHKDGNKQNNDVSNIHWCTPAENRRHAFMIGIGIGKRLTDKELSEIRSKYARGEITQEKLSAEYGVSIMSIYNAINYRLSYKPIPIPPTRHLVMIADIPQAS